MNYLRWKSQIPVLIGCAMLITWSSHAFAGTSSSCVTCHIDEDMLTDNLAVVAKKSSAMQSGAG